MWFVELCSHLSEIIEAIVVILVCVNILSRLKGKEHGE